MSGSKWRCVANTDSNRNDPEKAAADCERIKTRAAAMALTSLESQSALYHLENTCWTHPG
jgi:hypothetical protein